MTAPNYQLSKYLAEILKAAVDTSYNISDTFHFVEMIKNIVLPEGYIMVSFDVVSLFSNIPKALVRQGIISEWSRIQTATNINADLFIELVEFCLDSSYFCFDGKFHMQIFGTAMGSPISPILADLVMGILLKTVEKQLPFAIPILWKYVDDLLIALPHDMVQITLDTFNKYNEHIQFTCEKEVNSQLPFLDTLITRHPNQQLTTKWYSKPIASGRLLNFHSFHPLAMKMNVAHNFVKRVTSLTNDQPLEQQKQIIFQHLRRNDYPSALINRLLSRVHQSGQNLASTNETTDHPRISISSPSHNTPTTDTTPRCTTSQHEATSSNMVAATSNIVTTTNIVTAASTDTAATSQPQQNNNSRNNTATSNPTATYRALPHIPGLTAALVGIFRKDFPSVKIAQRTIRTTAKMINSVKSPVDPKLRSNVIYKIPCDDCGKVYIGMTTQHLRDRLYGHQSNINEYKRLVDRGVTTTDAEMVRLQEKTALVEHSIQYQHTFNLSNTTIIDQSYRAAALPILEMCHISGHSDAVNRRTDVDGLSVIYAGIIHAINTNTNRKHKNVNTHNSQSRLNTNVPTTSYAPTAVSTSSLTASSTSFQLPPQNPP